LHSLHRQTSGAIGAGATIMRDPGGSLKWDPGGNLKQDPERELEGKLPPLSPFVLVLL
jgi:hypothetical protein